MHGELCSGFLSLGNLAAFLLTAVYASGIFVCCEWDNQIKAGWLVAFLLNTNMPASFYCSIQGLKHRFCSLFFFKKKIAWNNCEFWGQKATLIKLFPSLYISPISLWGLISSSVGNESPHHWDWCLPLFWPTLLIATHVQVLSELLRDSKAKVCWILDEFSVMKRNVALPLERQITCVYVLCCSLWKVLLKCQALYANTSLHWHSSYR